MSETTSPSSLRPVLPILVAATVMMAVSMGIRQMLGIFVQPVTRDIALTISEFAFALSILNLSWGFTQPFAGAWAVRCGYRPIMFAGALLFVAGLAVFAAADGWLGVILGLGVLVGASLACSATAMGQAVAARAVPPAIRSLVLGIVSGTASLGTLIAAPLGQSITAELGWRSGALAILAFALLLLPSAWIAGRIDKFDRANAPSGPKEDVRALPVIKAALSHPQFLVMGGAYFVCGLQLLFLIVHLPSYLAICGMDPLLTASALATISVFNAFGSFFFGWLGGHFSKRGLLGCIYVSRSLVFVWYFWTPPTPESTLLFAVLMGFLWLGVTPLIAGASAEMFGVRWQAMISGLAFMSHQLGSFTGAFGGGVLYDLLGSYDLAWKLGAGIGLTAGVIQILSATVSPSDGGGRRLQAAGAD